MEYVNSSSTLPTSFSFKDSSSYDDIPNKSMKRKNKSASCLTGEKLELSSNNGHNVSREENLKRQRERARRNRSRKKEWIEWAHDEIARLTPEVENLNIQVPVLERFVEWLQQQEDQKNKE